MAKSHRRRVKELNDHFFLSFFFSFGIGFVIVLYLTEAKRLSGMTYHNYEIFCKRFIHVSLRHRVVTVAR